MVLILTPKIFIKNRRTKKISFPCQGKTIIKPRGPPWDEANFGSFPITVKGYDRAEEIRAATFLPPKGFLVGNYWKHTQLCRAFLFGCDEFLNRFLVLFGEAGCNMYVVMTHQLHSHDGDPERP